MAGTKGNCYLCGTELGKTAMKNHILKEHNGLGDGQECSLLKIEGAFDKGYWLYVDIPVNRTLSVLDTFLRKFPPATDEIILRPSCIPAYEYRF